MRFISWNVNGLRACLNKGFLDAFHKLDADIFAVQETKMQPEQATLTLEGYRQYWNSAEKRGYSGTAIFTRLEPLAVHDGIGIEAHDHEGRVITLEFPQFNFVTCYTPNSRRALERLDYRLTWEDAFRAYLQKLDVQKPVVVCGDLNVAHQEIDLRYPKANRKNAGFTDAERGKFGELLQAGFVDSFRHVYPAKTDCYTWWSYMRHAREHNTGWRIDYFLVSQRLAPAIQAAEIHSDILGSDHCPVQLDLQIN